MNVPNPLFQKKLVVKWVKIVVDSLPSISSMDWQKSCGYRKQGNSSVEENPTRALRLELRNVKSWKSVLGSPSLCLLCSYTFSTGTYCLAGSWLFLQVWRALCPQSDRFLVEGVEKPVASTARCTLGPFCWWSVHGNIALGFLLFSLRHWWDTDLHVALKLHFPGFMYEINVVSLAALICTGQGCQLHDTWRSFFEGLNSVTSFSRDGHASLGHQPAIVELFSASFLAGWNHPAFWCEAAWCALDSVGAGLGWMFVWVPA